MCGDPDSDGRLAFERDLYIQFLAHAQAFLEFHERNECSPKGSLPHYMNSLFADGLSRAARDVQHAPQMSRYARLSAQPMIFARLAGFLAAHLTTDEDPLRKTIEALMQGYAEPERLHTNEGIAAERCADYPQ
jgi:hypothetical protein